MVQKKVTYRCELFRNNFEMSIKIGELAKSFEISLLKQRYNSEIKFLTDILEDEKNKTKRLEAMLLEWERRMICPINQTTNRYFRS